MRVTGVGPLLAASILDPLYQTLGSLLAAFYAAAPSFGLAIVLLTVTVKVAMIPLTAKQIRSSQEMQRVAPQLKALQAKYKGDRQKLNEETMKFYKEHKVNPLSGCLPLLLQAPLFIVLYRLILGLSKPPFEHVPHGSAIFDALVASSGSMVSWGMDLSLKAGDAVGFAAALPFYLLIALVVATGFYQQRQMAARLPKEGMNAQMMMIGKILPVFMGFISLSIPAGVVLYFIASNLWQIGQQAVTFRNFPPPDATPAEGTPNGKEPKAKPAAKTATKPAAKSTSRAKPAPKISGRATPPKASRNGAKPAKGDDPADGGTARRQGAGRRTPEKPEKGG